MIERAKPLAAATWKRFRSYPLFVQLLLVVPVLCAMTLTLLVGNMGLALILHDYLAFRFTFYVGSRWRIPNLGMVRSQVHR